MLRLLSWPISHPNDWRILGGINWASSDLYARGSNSPWYLEFKWCQLSWLMPPQLFKFWWMKLFKELFLVFSHDILIYTATWITHMEHLHLVFFSPEATFPFYLKTKVSLWRIPSLHLSQLIGWQPTPVRFWQRFCGHPLSVAYVAFLGWWTITIKFSRIMA